MGSETTIARNGGITTTMVLNAICGILLVILGWNMQSIVGRLDEHDKELKAVDGNIRELKVKGEGSDAFIREIRQDIKDIKERLERRP